MKWASLFSAMRGSNTLFPNDFGEELVCHVRQLIQHICYVLTHSQHGMLVSAHFVIPELHFSYWQLKCLMHHLKYHLL